MKKFILLFTCLGCCQECYYNNYASFTNYDLDDYRKNKTPYGITVYTNTGVNHWEVDERTRELETCLGIRVRKVCFAILVPDDWFYSTTSGQELLPYAAPIEYCWEKGLDIPFYCEGVVKPTNLCPLTCNWRVATQDNFLIVTGPSLILYKAELARLVTGINNPWENETLRPCL